MLGDEETYFARRGFTPCQSPPPRNEEEPTKALRSPVPSMRGEERCRFGAHFQPCATDHHRGRLRPERDTRGLAPSGGVDREGLPA